MAQSIFPDAYTKDDVGSGRNTINLESLVYFQGALLAAMTTESTRGLLIFKIIRMFRLKRASSALDPPPLQAQ